jgi:hypothetical protein
VYGGDPTYSSGYNPSSGRQDGFSGSRSGPQTIPDGTVRVLQQENPGGTTTTIFDIVVGAIPIGPDGVSTFTVKGEDGKPNLTFTFDMNPALKGRGELAR